MISTGLTQGLYGQEGKQARACWADEGKGGYVADSMEGRHISGLHASCDAGGGDAWVVAHKG